MNDDQLLRYSRHILLNELGVEGQEKLLASHAVVVGAGGLGSPVVLYLASAGVGHITLIDHDTVDATNLQRQIAHNEDRVGQAKVISACTAMHAINPEIRIDALQQRADDALLDRLLPTAHVVLDCTDNFKTRHMINRLCVAHKVPLVSGAGIRFDGQLAVYDPRDATSPCYACVFPDTEELEETRCATMGVFAPLVGIVGTMQAAEALKLLSGMGSRLVGRLMMLDGRGLEFNEVRLSRNPSCAVCGTPTLKP
jgi:molybdopterin/thiamine biosynthesis adenylyltransferase